MPMREPTRVTDTRRVSLCVVSACVVDTGVRLRSALFHAKKWPSVNLTRPLKRMSGVMAQSGHQRKNLHRERDRERERHRDRGREGAMEERGEGIVKSSFDSCETKLKKSPGR